MEGGQLKLVLLAHMALEGIYLGGLRPGMSPELYGLSRHIIFRHGITQLLVKMSKIVGEAEEVFDDDLEKDEDGMLSGEQTAKLSAPSRASPLSHRSEGFLRVDQTAPGHSQCWADAFVSCGGRSYGTKGLV